MLAIRNAFIGIFCVICLPSLSCEAGNNNPPQFKDYPVKHIYAGKSAKLVLSTPEARNYRTRLREASKEKINYSGEYVLTYWGCGCCCRSAAVVSLKTGQVIFLPEPITQPPADIEEDILQYRPDSRLLIVVGLLGEEGDKDGFGRHYFELRGGGFMKVHFVPLPKLSREEFRRRMEKGIDDAMHILEQKKLKQ